ncbi:MFS transporter [Coxiella endosymbiont of Amblyomma nuttalli]|uniref:MFS transporter n=1 Tax=Coxiella endosymbiont of Amblyomma nuttalli TaxID=2749996 RepID=UPI0021119AF4|nr:MFS transporter [Coxiella endosymbiont of Amblyomma nuttalli]
MTSLENSLHLQPHERLDSWCAWLVCLSASLFFFYEFIQMNMFDSISTQLMQTFHIKATELGQLSCFYFVSNVIFLFPAGILLDCYSTRKIILFSLGICILGIFLFALTKSVFWASMFRFLIGVGGAFCFLSVIRLATRWFSSTQLALVTGIIITMAMLGGMIAQTPLALLVKAMNWRKALLIDAVLGILIFAIIASIVKDFPLSYCERYQLERQEMDEIGYWKSMKLAFLKLQNWLGGIYTCLMNLALSLLGGIWGILYLIDAHKIARLDATYVISMLFLGTMIGSPAVGFFSDKISLRRLPMLIGAILSLMLVLVIIYEPHLSFATLLFLFFSIGLTTSTQAISYPMVAESSMPVITATSVSIVNITTIGGQAIFQPLFGRLMDLQILYCHHLPINYGVSDFQRAMLILPIGFLVAFIAAFCLRETHCRFHD